MRRRMRSLAALIAVLGGLALLAAPSASADTDTRIVDHGWWWRVQSGVATELPPPPGVEEGQLMVQSSPEGAQAIAAVWGVLADGQTDPVLTLDVATDGGAAAAVVLACQAGSAWIGEDAGRWDSRPEADCTTSVTGLPSEDGSQWTFGLGPLQIDDHFSIVLVPGQLADSDLYPSFSLTFSEPTADSITTSAGDTPAPTVPTPAVPTPTSPPTVAVPAPSSHGTFAPPPTAPATARPITTPPTTVVAQPTPDAGRAPSEPVPALEEVAAATLPAPESRTLARVIGAIVLLAGLSAAAATHRGATLAGAAATPDAPVVGGLARFRAERTSEPTPVS